MSLNYPGGFAQTPSNMTRILLSRHGETDWNAERRIQGSTDTLLNPRGEEQARLLAGRLAAMQFTAIYASDYKRALRTAEFAHVKHPGVPLITAPELRERNWGSLEGLRWDDIMRDRPDVAEGITSGDPDYALPGGGESRAQVLRRATSLFIRIVKEHPAETVAVFTHGGVCATVLKHALGVAPATRTSFLVENCALHILDFDGKTWTVRTLNDMSHLNGCCG